MSFLKDLVGQFSHSGQSQSQSQSQPSGSYQQSSPQNQGAPPVSPPWFAEWDGRDQRWLFINQQTGERTFNYPGPGYAQQQGGYNGNNQGAYNQGSYNTTGGYGQPEQEKKQGGNGWKYAAAGVAGVAGGALLMHEGEELHDDYEGDKYRLESDVSNFPQNTAQWTGEQVGRVENFDDRVDQKWDNAVSDVENFPENAAQWTGEKVQEVEDVPQDIENRWDNDVAGVERFGDRMDDAYDEGRDEQRYDDDN